MLRSINVVTVFSKCRCTSLDLDTMAMPRNSFTRNSFEDVVAAVHENNKLTGESVRYCTSNGELLDDIVMVL
jgi:hypothetical protein